MKNLQVITREQATPKAQEILDGMQKRIGMVPNLYGVAAASYPGVKALFDLSGTLAAGEFTPQEGEAIALVIAEGNGCEYCLAAHTAAAIMHGFSEAHTFELRNATIDDPKLGALTALAKAIVSTRGWPDQDLIDAFFAVGYSRAALVELVGMVALHTFTNYLNHISGTPIDFSAAKSLESTGVS